MKSIAESVISQRQDDGAENNQRKLLSQALKEAPYKRMDKPNKNLIHDDHQDIKSHLEKRLYNTQSIWRRLSNYNVDEEVQKFKVLPNMNLIPFKERSSVRSGNSDWIQNVKQSRDMRKASLMSNALSAWTEAGSQRGRVRTVSTSSVKQKPQDMV